MSVGYESNIAALSGRFASRLPARVTALTAAVEALAPGQPRDALDALRIDLHSMAGTAPTLGFAEIGRLAREAETAAKPDIAMLDTATIARLRQEVLALAAACAGTSA